MVGRAHAPGCGAAAAEQAAERERQVGSLAAAVEPARHRKPGAPEQATVVQRITLRAPLQPQAGEPQQQAQQMHAEQAAQGPHHIDRPRAVAECTRGGTEAEHEGEREGEHQHQPRPPLPAHDRLAPARGGPERAGATQDACLEVARGRARLGVRPRLIKRRVVFFMAADELGQPALGQGIRRE